MLLVFIHLEPVKHLDTSDFFLYLFKLPTTISYPCFLLY